MDEYSINVEEWNDDWEYVSRDVMHSYYEDHLDELSDDIDNTGDYIDEYVNNNEMPMMLYAYPLHDRPTDDEIIEISKTTACTVVMNRNTEDYFLALAAGGMDLSQDIAMAYIMAHEEIPSGLAINVCTQHNLRYREKDWSMIMQKCIDSLMYERYEYTYKINEINKEMKKIKKVKEVM